MVIRDATPADLDAVRRLFRAYEAMLDFDLCFQGFDDELASLPGDYAPPKGRLLVVDDGTNCVGCVALRPLAGGECEMKRLYLEPGVRGRGVGRRLAERVIDAARRAGYRTMRLDTVAKLSEAIALYRSLGFVESPPYGAAAPVELLYFTRDLAASEKDKTSAPAP